MQPGAGPDRDRGSSAPLQAGRLLVAAPVLVASSFARTVVLLLDRDAHGVPGVVRNGPSDVDVAEVLGPWGDVVGSPAVLFQAARWERARPWAWPCSPTGMARRRSSRSAGGRCSRAPGWSTSTRPASSLDRPCWGCGSSLGTPGWSAGHLEAEIDAGAWFVVPGEEQDGLCADPERLRTRVLRRQPGPLARLATYPEDPTQN